MRSHRVGAAVCAVVCSALALRYAWPEPRAVAPTPLQKSAVAPSAVQATAAAPALIPAAVSRSPWVLGSVRSYAVDLKLETSLASGATGASGAAAGTVSEVALAGRWEEAFVGGDGGVARYRIALVASAFSASGQVEDTRALRAELARPFFVERDAEGATRAFYFEREVGEVARGLLRTAVATRQVTLRAGQDWQATEQDPTGELVAHYTRSGDSGEVRKERLRYTRLSTARGLRPTEAVGSASGSAHTRIMLNASGQLERLDATSSTEVQIGEGLPRALGRLTGSFVFREERVDAQLARAFEGARGQVEQVAMVTKPDLSASAEAERESNAQIVGSATLTDLTRQLSAVPVTDAKARAEAMAKLRAGFALRPEDAARVVPLLEKMPEEDGKAVTAALGGVGTPPAQRALVSVVDDPRTPMPVRLNASAAILLLERPETTLVASLVRQTRDSDRDVRWASTFALGSIVSKVDDAGSGLRTLIDAFSAARAPEDRVLSLRALGNSGDARIVPLALSALSDANADVRAAAVNAVRFVSGAEADQLLAGAMLTDADPEVRRKAIDTVTGFRFVPSFFAAYGTVLSQEAFPLVRRAVAQSLGKVRSTPEAIALLQRASNDASEDVRAVALASLSAVAQ